MTCHLEVDSENFCNQFLSFLSLEQWHLIARICLHCLAIYKNENFPQQQLKIAKLFSNICQMLHERSKICLRLAISSKWQNYAKSGHVSLTQVEMLRAGNLCDQIGRFFKVLGNNFLTKVAEMFGDFGLFLVAPPAFKVKTASATFGQLLEVFGLYLIPTSGHTAWQGRNAESWCSPWVTLCPFLATPGPDYSIV